MATAHLDEVRADWPAALEAARRSLDEFERARLLSLSALYAEDFETGSARLREATALDPFQPVHLFRSALHLARFGDLVRASAVAERLKALLPDAPIVDYLRALLALRSGRPDQARGIAATIETALREFIEREESKPVNVFNTETNKSKAVSSVR